MLLCSAAALLLLGRAGGLEGWRAGFRDAGFPRHPGGSKK